MPSTSRPSTSSLTRRRFLTELAKGGSLLMLGGGMIEGLLSASAAAQPAAQGKSEFLVRMARPLDLEMPLSALDSWLTPAARLFVRSHFDAPRLDPQTWRLNLKGLVHDPLSLTLDDLRRFKPTTVIAVLQCSGNGRSLYSPKVPGVQWAYGAVGNASWTGVRLVDVLKQAGLKNGARYVWMQGGDRPVMPATPRFIRALPLEKALHPDTLIAYELNGEPLPMLHGFPVRLVVPGWVGDDWVKWLSDVTVSPREPEGYFYQTAYRYPSAPVDPGQAVAPRDMTPLTALAVKSLVARPLHGDVLPMIRREVRGVAWSGEDARIERVEVSTDAGETWAEGELFGPDERYAWRQWRYEWSPTRPGTYVIMARATDSRGETQPAVSPWNPSGFLRNGYHSVTVTIRA